jgi:hypothetical protein
MSSDNSGTIRHDIQNEAMALHTPKPPLDEVPPAVTVEPEAKPEPKPEEEPAEEAATHVDAVTVTAE